MTSRDIAYYRICSQQINGKKFRKPEQVVRWMGAVQAQDYPAALWAVGLRTQQSKETDIERALANKKIVRTWLMRGTLHFVAAEDLRWMLKLLAPRVLALRSRRHRELELDHSTFRKSREVLETALEESEPLTRPELYRELEDSNISTAGQRGYHILTWLALQGVICFGPRRGKQHTFVLPDEWLPEEKEPLAGDALAELARRYIASHGPATVYDFAGWSGLTITDARTALKMIGPDLNRTETEGQTYWFLESTASITSGPSGAYLLPAFDEILCGYKDRSAVLDSKEIKSAILKNGIFSPVIIRDGKVTGTWKRRLKKKEVEVKISPFVPPGKNGMKAVAKAAREYGYFLGTAVKITTENPG